MSEKRDIQENKIEYEGLFKIKELFENVKEWAEDNGFDLLQKEYAEAVTETGKEIKMPLDLEKKASDYVKFILLCRFSLDNVEDVLVKKGKSQQKLNKGKVVASLKAVIETDYEDKWHKKPFWIFLKGLHDKFLMSDEITEFENQIKKDLNSLADELKAHLNLFQYKT